MSKELALQGNFVCVNGPTVQRWERRRQGEELDPPLLLDPIQRPPEEIVFPCAAPDAGAVIRVPEYDGMAAGQTIVLDWDGNLPFRVSARVTVTDRYIDFRVPKDLLLQTAADSSVQCHASYVVREAGKPDRASAPTTFLVTPPSPAPPVVVVPAAPEGELDFSTIDREVGLPVRFPDEEIINGRWLSCSSDGRPNAFASFRVERGETVNIWRELLDQVEPEGDVRIWYMGSIDHITPSKMVTIRALWGNEGALDAPLLVNPFAQDVLANLLYTGACPETGAVFRVPVYEYLSAGQDIVLNWEGPLPFSTSLRTTASDRYVDLQVPKDLLVRSTENGVAHCKVSYTVLVSGKPSRTSPQSVIDIVPSPLAPPPVAVPAASNGELDFSTIDRDIGLPVTFPEDLSGPSHWISYGRDGRRKSQFALNALPGQTVNVPGHILDEVEPGGEVLIWYSGTAGGFSYPSRMCSIRAL